MILKIKPDKGKAKGMMKLINMRIETLPSLRKISFANVIAETYYEIIKEMSISFLLIKGFRTVGESFHRDLFLCMHRLKIFDSKELALIDDLRIRRNKSLYSGKEISLDYLNVKEKKLNEIIKKLKSLLDSELKEW